MRLGLLYTLFFCIMCIIYIVSQGRNFQYHVKLGRKSWLANTFRAGKTGSVLPLFFPECNISNKLHSWQLFKPKVGFKYHIEYCQRHGELSTTIRTRVWILYLLILYRQFDSLENIVKGLISSMLSSNIDK